MDNTTYGITYVFCITVKAIYNQSYEESTEDIKNVLLELKDYKLINIEEPK